MTFALVEKIKDKQSDVSLVLDYKVIEEVLKS